jgi:putative transposase
MRCCITPTAAAQDTSEQFQRLIADNGVDCSMSRSGNVWDNAAMESFFSSLKTERIGQKVYRTRDAARADVFDYIERFYTRSAGTRPSATSARLSSKGRWISLTACPRNRQQAS